MEKSRSTAKNLWWMVRQIFTFDKIYIFVISISMCIIGIIPSISTLVSQEIINGVQSKKEINVMLILIIIYVCIDLVQVISNLGLDYYKTQFSLKFNLYFNELILNKAETLSLHDYENSETYDMINRAQYEGNGKLLLYIDMLMNVFSSIVTMLSFLFIMMTFRPWIVLCIIVIPVIKFFISKRINVKSFEIIRNRTNDERRRWYIHYLLTYGEYYKELKTYNLFAWFIKKYKSYTQKFNRDDLNLEKERTVSLSFMSIIEALVEGLLFAYVIFCGYTGAILIGNVLTYIKTITQVKIEITNILEIFSEMNKESLFISQLIEYFEIPENKEDGKIKISKIENIKVCNLYFKYQASEEYILKGINFEIKDKESVAIVGQNGSGKSTLIKLLMGFYNDYEGEIYINGIELKKIDRDDLKLHIATLFQDFVKYEATFRENIGYGNLEILEDDEKIFSVMKQFDLEEVVGETNKGLDTQLGYWFDNGKQISEGQWQRIGLSRAFVKNADLYILDEPNSALDAISEYELSKSYLHLLDGHMGIIIAHKFNNIIKKVDKIVLLSGGEIVGQGNHEYLMKKSDMYKVLYNVQRNEDFDC